MIWNTILPFYKSIHFFILAIAAVLTSACSSLPDLTNRNEFGAMYSPSEGATMDYSVYLPPGWTADETLPLVVLLHGYGDNHESFDRYQVGQFLDPYIESGELPRVIILNPLGGNMFWENWYDGSHKLRDWVVRDLMPEVASKYNTLPCPEHCHVTGISMGAHGALRFAYHEPDTFSSAASISGLILSREKVLNPSLGRRILFSFVPTERIWGPIYEDYSDMPEDIDPFVAWIHDERLKQTRLMLTWGSEESKDIQATNVSFHDHLKQNQRPHEYQTFAGGHNWNDWKPHILATLTFHLKGDDTLD